MTLRSSQRPVPELDIDQLDSPELDVSQSTPPVRLEGGHLLSPATYQQLIDAADLILSHPRLLDQRSLARLLEELPQYCHELPENFTKPIYTANFDLMQELDTQLKTVRALRNAILTETNELREGMTTKDVMELNRTSTNLTNLLMKHHKDVVNMDRLRAVEEAVLSVIMTWPEAEEREKFVAAMEKALADLN